jgi:hypothetical protein
MGLASLLHADIVSITPSENLMRIEAQPTEFLGIYPKSGLSGRPLALNSHPTSPMTTHTSPEQGHLAVYDLNAYLQRVQNGDAKVTRTCLKIRLDRQYGVAALLRCSFISV